MSDPGHTAWGEDFTYFCKTGRSSRTVLENQSRGVLNDSPLSAMLDGVAGLGVILNENSEILAANQHAHDVLRGEVPVGLRPGEALNCINITEGPDGCGTSQHCGDCGIAQAIVAANEYGITAERDCRLEVLQNHEIQALSFRARAVPLAIAGSDLVVLVLRDTTVPKRTHVPNNAVSHDVPNKNGRTDARSELLPEADAPASTTRDRHIVNTSYPKVARRGAPIQRKPASRTSKKRVQLIDTDPATADHVRTLLTQSGYELIWTRRGLEGLETVQLRTPDLVILDLLLPDLPGLEICRQIRASEDLRALPILILTAQDRDDDRVLGLETGADDYLVKPFNPAEFSARVKALLRRGEPADRSGSRVQVGDLVLEVDAVRVTRAGEPVPVTALEFRLLYFLASNPNRVFSRDQLLDAVWGHNHYVGPRIVDVYIRQLRQKLSPSEWLKTLRGSGYMLEAPEFSTAAPN